MSKSSGYRRLPIHYRSQYPEGHTGVPSETSTSDRITMAPWPHDPRTGPLTQPTDEQLSQAMQAFSDHPETFTETVERIGKAVAEDIDGVWPDTLTVIGADPGTDSKIVYQLWERNGKRLDWVTGGPVLRQEGEWEPGEVEALVEMPREEFSQWLERDGLREEK